MFIAFSVCLFFRVLIVMVEGTRITLLITILNLYKTPQATVNPTLSL